MFTISRNIRATGILGIGVALLVAAGAAYLYFGTARDVTITPIQDKHQVFSGVDEGKYLVESEEETFEVTGALLSSRVRLDLERGHTYKCRVSGLRFPLFRWRRKIRSCTEEAPSLTTAPLPGSGQGVP
ncbi:MAG: hypothetical protein WDZ37_05050 [Solirubrobacterales bacterium]